MTLLDRPDITRPLRLAVGNHRRGSGKGCAMNLISWENGDTQITDLPDCADPMLARIVQRVNDQICDHRDGDLLCPPCSITVLELAHRTVGTGTLGLTELERRVIWVKIAVDQARQVAHLVRPAHRDRAEHAITLAERWTTDPDSVSRTELHNAATAAAAYATADATAAAYATATAATAAAYATADAAATADAYAAADAAAAYAAYAADAAYAAYAADAADAAVSKPGARLALATRAFDLFDELTRHARVEVDTEQVARIYEAMTACPVGTR